MARKMALAAASEESELSGMAEYHRGGDAIGRCLPAGDLAEVLRVPDKLARAAVPDAGVAIP